MPLNLQIQDLTHQGHLSKRCNYIDNPLCICGNRPITEE